MKLTTSGNEYGFCGVCTQHTPGDNANIFACFFDRDNDNKFEAVSWGLTEASLEYKPRYSVGELMISSAGGYKYEIIYLRATKTSLKLKYKAYSDDIAEPKYLQDIEYPVAVNGTASGEFKGLSMKFLSIGETHITYTLSGEFDEAMPAGKYASERRSPEADRLHQEKLDTEELKRKEKARAREEQVRKEKARAKEEARRTTERKKTKKLQLEKAHAEKLRLEQERAERQRKPQSYITKNSGLEAPEAKERCKQELFSKQAAILSSYNSEEEIKLAVRIEMSRCMKKYGYERR